MGLRKTKGTNSFLGLMGDVMIGRLVNRYLSHAPPNYLWGDVLPILKETDINLINLETSLTSSTEAVPKVFNFKAYPENVRSLTEGHIDVVNLANNHILDFSAAGLRETILTLDTAGIYHVGAGENAEQAKRPAILTCNDIRIGILGCTDNEPSWKSTPSSEGTRFIDITTIDPLKEDIQRLREQVDIVILSIHWGPNMKEQPSANFIRFAHQAIDSGVDIIHGHSAHIFQGVEIYQGKLILYDTGDFVDDYAVDPLLRNDRSFLFLVEAGKEGVVALYLIPVLIGDFQVNLSSGKEFLETGQRMQRLSQEFHTTFAFRHEPFPHLFLRIGTSG